MIYKQRGQDLWVVVQNLPLGKDDSTEGEIVYRGPGKLKIAEVIRECHRTFLETKPRTKEGVDPALEAFDCKDQASLYRHTNAMTLMDIGDQIYGTFFLAKTNAPDWFLEFSFAYEVEEMDGPNWPRTSWEQIQKGFAYVERCKP